jgi:uncharacterized protein YoxC
MNIGRITLDRRTLLWLAILALLVLAVAFMVVQVAIWHTMHQVLTDVPQVISRH